MADQLQKLTPISVRFSDEELQLLATAQAIIAKQANNSDLRVTQRTALVSALRLFIHEKTRRAKS